MGNACSGGKESVVPASGVEPTAAAPAAKEESKVSDDAQVGAVQDATVAQPTTAAAITPLKPEAGDAKESEDDVKVG